jgi:ABC-type Mn2+/Zn2+ transport system ATPase subunit
MAIETSPRPVIEPAGSAAAIDIESVTVRLGDNLALRDVSCRIEPGAFVGVIGPNGSGKSTLLRSILGILPLASGRITIDGKAPAQSRALFAYLPQRQHLEFDLPLRVWDVAMMGRLRHTGWFRRANQTDRSAVASALDSVAMLGMRNAPIGELSFGQQQRVLFARALAQEGSILLLDEPMSGVDPQTQEQFLETLAMQQARGATILMATHDLNQAAAVCDTICVLNQRLVAYGDIRETLSEAVLREAYGAHLHFLAGGADVGHFLDDAHHHGAVEPHG